MIRKMFVKTDGIDYYAREKGHRPYRKAGRSLRSEKSKKFDEFYFEATYNGVCESEILNYIQLRFLETADDICDDSLTEEECRVYYNNFLNRRHKQQRLYEEKLFMLKPNYWTTFTYDDKKETAETFEKRLMVLFNNLGKRKGWKVIGGWELGEEGERSHFHAFIFVPKGQMIGELVCKRRYSRKKRKIEYYTDNTYFSDRFGISDWVAIDKRDLLSGRLRKYLVKYMFKSGRRLFYSRGIPNEIEIEIDLENDVFMSYYNHGVHHLLYQELFSEDRLFNIDKETDIELFTFDKDSPYIGYNDDIHLLPVVY